MGNKSVVAAIHEKKRYMDTKKQASATLGLAGQCVRPNLVTHRKKQFKTTERSTMSQELNMVLAKLKLNLRLYCRTSGEGRE